MWYFLLFAALLGADQLIKYWTVEHLTLGESAAFWPGVMRPVSYTHLRAHET